MSSSVNAPDVDARLRALRTIWAAMLGSVFLYAVLGYALHPPAFTWRALGYAGEGGSVGVALVTAGLYVVALAAVLCSQFVLRSFLRRAEAEQNTALVQTGFILALAVCEAGALIGLVILFLAGTWLAFALMGASAMMMVVLRPRREMLAAAGYKTGLTQ
jgi:hypothetical protein